VTPYCRRNVPRGGVISGSAGIGTGIRGFVGFVEISDIEWMHQPRPVICDLVKLFVYISLSAIVWIQSIHEECHKIDRPITAHKPNL